MHTAFASSSSIRPLNWRLFRTQCSDSSSNRGFGRRPPTDNVKKPSSSSSSQLEQNKLQRKLTPGQSGQAPGLGIKLDKGSPKIRSDLDFEQKLEAVRRSALTQKKTVEEKEFGAIDYDAPTQPKQRTIGLGTKIGVGVAVVVFGLVFALGDFLPSGSISSNENDQAVSTPNLSKEERAILQAKLQQFEATLSDSPKDPVALEGAAVTLTELGEYTKAVSLLEDLSKEKPNDPDVFRLLGEVKYELKDYESSVAAYKTSRKIGNPLDFEILRGLTNALLAANRPDEAVQVLLEARDRINMDQSTDVKSDTSENQLQKMDAIQVDLLLGKAYSDWGHINDAVSVYDQLISSHPNDFRGYLAKGIILKQNGSLGEAERMFIQARFFAPEKAKPLVDRYSRQ